jgi:uncharacterized protein (TIGR03437 family)
MEKSLPAILLTLSLSLVSQAQSPFQPIQSGYGANGTFAVTDDKFSSPLYDSENVHVFRPAGATAPAPVIFFAPGFANNDPREYEPLIKHVVSRGYALVYAPFQIVSGDATLHKKRYDTIFAGFEEAVNRYGSSFDLTRVGYAGHSYGGSAILNMAVRGLERGWGKDGLFLFMMAPWYYYEMSLSQFVNFPRHAKVIVQVYEQDGVCDHRIGKEIFERINLPASEKDFVMLMREERLGYKLEADHGTPSGSGQDAHDFYGVYRLLDALADYAFDGREEARRIALGGGSAEQRYMGLWPDGSPVREMFAGDCVAVTRSSLSFVFPYSPTTIAATNVSSASFNVETGVAPESLTSALGTNLSKYPLPNEAPIPPLTLNGTLIRVKDSACEERLAPLFFVAPTQVNYLMPAGTANGAATVTVFNEAGAISVGTAQVNSVAPSLFAANSNGQGAAAASVLRVKAGGSQNYEPATRWDLGLARYVTLPIDLSDPNDHVFLLLFGTGFRYRQSLSGVSVTIGGLPIDVWYAGAQGEYYGLDQINLLLPRTLVGRGEMDVVLKVDGRTANSVRINVK